MATKLSVYNNALSTHLGERILSSLTESRKSRRVLDQVWDSGFVTGVLEDGQWGFATRTVLMDYNPDVDPDFGHQYAFDKQSDWVRTIAVSLNEFLTDPLLMYNDEGDYLYTSAQSIYWAWISDGANYGGDLARWSESFTAYAECKLAASVAKSITHNDELVADLRRECAKLLKIARAKDGMNKGAKMIPRGNWIRSRGGSRNGGGNSMNIQS
jgi:hypothetical protein